MKAVELEYRYAKTLTRGVLGLNASMFKGYSLHSEPSRQCRLIEALFPHEEKSIS
jgi:ribonucleotide reductase beta subunit family protein with ferritin-like domain